MSVRFDASGDSLGRTTNLPPIASFTMMGWFYISVDRAALSTFLAFGPATLSNYYQAYITGARNFRLYNGPGGNVAGASTLSVGQWYHIAMTVSGTGASQFLGYVNGVLDATHSGQASLTAGKLWVGNDNDTEWLNGRAAAIKVWDTALTAAEIQQEMHTLRPQRLADLNAYYPVFPGSGERVRDYSGNGRDWTEAGTLADEDPPPVGWGAAIQWLQAVVAGATTYTVNLAGSISPTGTLSKQIGKPLTGSISPAGALVKQAQRLLSGNVSPGGTIAKQAQKGYAGSISPAGALTRQPGKSLAGSVSPSGTVTKRADKSLSGSVSPSGSLTKQLARAFVGSITPAGVLTATRVILLALAGSISPSGALQKLVGKQTAGSVSPSGAVTKHVSVTYTGSITPEGSLRKAIAKTFTGAISAAGSLVASVIVAGAVSRAAPIIARVTVRTGLTRLAVRFGFAKADVSAGINSVDVD